MDQCTGDALQRDVEGRIDLKLRCEEAEAVLAILSKHRTQKPIEEEDWQNLFTTEPYIMLKKREAEMGVGFTDEDFKCFVFSPELAQRFTALQQTLERWKEFRLLPLASRVLKYLPTKAFIRANVFPMIKPRSNSFVYSFNTDANLFLYVDPQLTPLQFENIVAHELHHIGLFALSKGKEIYYKGLPPNVRAAVSWIDAFGEGLAMLAAASSPDVHPHAANKAGDRACWDRALANFNQDLKAIEIFLLDIINQRLTGEEIEKAGFSFYGDQGPWYTVGWKMAVVVERRYGKEALRECMLDLRLLLLRYNLVADEMSRNTETEQLACWSQELILTICGKRA